MKASFGARGGASKSTAAEQFCVFMADYMLFYLRAHAGAGNYCGRRDKKNPPAKRLKI